MTIIAYLLTILLVPLIAILISMPSFFLFIKADKDFLPFISVLIGIVTGAVSVFLVRIIFKGLNVEFTSTPIWILFIMYALNDWRRIGRSMSEKASIIEVGQMIGTPIGLYWAF
jgi:hypothetical protein